ncbi:outer membrane protein [Larkinella sp. C7]|uniref:outer membrane protein n=1 Tax=Larkinella sp. C7 TaxID=2576607 RepID=UPI0011110885|nr:transporter [Larkinella sp. C7]
MKKYSLWIALLLPITGWAQSATKSTWLEQGQMQVGIGVGASVGDTIGGYLRVTPYAQYFLKNNWALRIEGRYNYNGPNGDQYLGAGLTTQYHFLHTKRLSIYGQAGYFYGQANYKSLRFVQETPNSMRLEPYRSRYGYGMVNVGLGVQYRLSDRWVIHALAEKYIQQSVNHFRKPTDRHSITVGISFQIK